MEQKRIRNKFTWVSKSEQNSRFGGMSSSKDIRCAKYWILNDDDSIYFVNESDDVIDKLIYSSGGMCTVDDDDVVSVSVREKFYNNVLPGEAVKISEYDVIYDSDYVLQYEVTVMVGNCSDDYRTMPFKGGFREEVLVWK